MAVVSSGYRILGVDLVSLIIIDCELFDLCILYFLAMCASDQEHSRIAQLTFTRGYYVIPYKPSHRKKH